MAELFDGLEIPIPCPECEHTTPKKVGWLKSNNQFPCPGCGKTITLKSEELIGGLADFEKEMEKFGRDISKTIDIKV